MQSRMILKLRKHYYDRFSKCSFAMTFYICDFQNFFANCKNDDICSSPFDHQNKVIRGKLTLFNNLLQSKSTIYIVIFLSIEKRCIILIVIKVVSCISPNISRVQIKMSIWSFIIQCISLRSLNILNRYHIAKTIFILDDSK